jgi:peptidoglycan hydrolase-like protein with peptidoglycan-binding domain
LLAIVLSASTARSQSDATSTWWQSLPEGQRYAIQADLILLGYYSGFVDGTFGPLTKTALGQFQLSEGVTGPAPTTEVLEALRSRGLEAYSSYGFTLEKHPADGVAVFVPRAVLTKKLPGEDGGIVFATEDEGIVLHFAGWDYPNMPLAEWAPGLLKAGPNQTIEYRSVQDDQLVISGRQDNATYYTMLAVDYPKVVGVTVSWLDEYASHGKIIATYAASYSGATTRLEKYETEPEQTPVLSPELGGPALAAMDGQRIGSFLLPNIEPKAIALVGEIGVGTVLEFRRALKARPGATTILLDSVGGSVNEGLLLAHEVADQKLSTFVPRGAVCYSACAYVFFAGHARSATGALGVHQIYGTDVSASDAQTVLSDVLDALAEFEVPQEVISVMLRTRPDQMHVFSKDEKEMLKLNRGELNVATLADRKVDTEMPPEPVSPSEGNAPSTLHADTVVALRSDGSDAALQFLGVWTRAQMLCERVDTPTARDFAIITKSTYRDGAQTYFGNFGGLVSGVTDLEAANADAKKTIHIKQWSKNVLSIDGVTMTRCAFEDIRRSTELGL